MSLAMLFYYLYYVLLGYFYILIASAILSWIPELHKTGFYRFIRTLSDPYMRLFRGLLVIGMVDLTPILGFFLYQIGLNYFAKMVNMMLAG